MTASLSLVAEAALLVIRAEEDGASVSRSGVVFVGGRAAPFAFVVCEALEQAGLVEMRLAADVRRGRLTVHATAAGLARAVSPLAIEKFRSWGRRYED